jgi:oligopeptide/dipeptide ABC transporter ATP-binding protein
MTKPTLLELRNLVTILGNEGGLLRRRRPGVRAVNGIDLIVRDGEIYGIVGESGSGKTTLARTILGMQRETSGEIRLEGAMVSGRNRSDARHARRDIQYVHQDAGASLDPWWSIGGSLVEPSIIQGMTDDLDARADRMLTAVGLPAEVKRRYPHEMSGGQLRRVALARVLMLLPKILILDEPTAGLDVSVQASVLGLLRELRDQFNLTYIFISHDLSVVRLMCSRVAIMYLGEIVEEADAAALFAAPRHPYTRKLLAAAPTLKRRADFADASLQDSAVDARLLPGCAFRPQCRHATARCETERPERTLTADGHWVKCHNWETLPPANKAAVTTVGT